ncbi:MAG: PHP domain-containing protein [Gammaproteobacteria bacterium]
MSDLYDFHCHSTASDGALSPSALVQRAHQQGVNVLALTDHDTTAGLAEANVSAVAAGIKFIPGIELSTTWQGKCLHIVGLNIDPNYPPLAEATRNLQKIRLERAEKIAYKLEKKHIAGAFQAVQKAAGNGMITRTHFSDFLLSQGHVHSQQEAFDRYLAKGKPAYVQTHWTELSLAVNWIAESGGIAVLAHPLRYNLSAAWMKRLLGAFKEIGGHAIEVITGRITAEEISLAAKYARCYDLAGSIGSDFHTPDNPWIELGRLEPLPKEIKPVWELLGLNSPTVQ